MSQKEQSKENILFTIIIFLIIIIASEITFVAITYYNETHPPIIEKKEEEEPVIKHFLTLAKPNPSKSLDLYQTYPENPISITFAKNRVLIDGLKNSATEAKINEMLKELDASENERGEHDCKINFNVSNVLSLTCKKKSKNIDLTTGHEIKLEEIFNDQSDIALILLNGIYDTYCLSGGCNIDAQNNTMDFENEARKIIQKIQNQDYNFHITNKEISFDDLLLNNENVIIRFFNNLNDLTIYNRFLTTENIFEKEILEYCHPTNCTPHVTPSNLTNSYIETKFLNANNIFIEFKLEKENLSSELSELDLKSIGSKVLNELISKYNLSAKESYQVIYINANINNYTAPNYQVKYQIDTVNTPEELYPKVLLGYKDNILNTETINNDDLLVDNLGAISYIE